MNDPAKFLVTKADGSPLDPRAIYFVIRLDNHGTNEEETLAARQAAHTYSEMAEHCNPDAARAARDRLMEALTRETRKSGK